MRAACALRIFSGRIIFIFGIAERLRTLRYPIFTKRGRKGKRHLPRSKQKAPEGGCSPGKKGLMILYLFVVVGVLDLECNCHVALFGIDVSLNNNANLRPIAILVDVDIRIGIDLPRDLIQNNTQQRIFIGNVRRHENRQELCILSLSFCSIAKNVFIAKNTAGNIEFLFLL